MALVNRPTRFGSPATSNPQDSSYQTALFKESAGSLSSYSGFDANTNGTVPGNFNLPATEETTTTTSTTTSTTTVPPTTTTTSTTTTTTTV